jgi:hypothetical protein
MRLQNAWEEVRSASSVMQICIAALIAGIIIRMRTTNAMKIRRNGCGIKIERITATILIPEEGPHPGPGTCPAKTPGLSLITFSKSKGYMDKTAPVVIARAWADSEASVIKSLLESYDIPCHYSSELPNRLFPVPEEDLGQIKLFVPAALEQEAKRILEEHRRRRLPLRLVED